MLENASVEINICSCFNYPCDPVILRRTRTAAERVLLLRYHFSAAFQHRDSNSMPGEALKGSY